MNAEALGALDSVFVTMDAANAPLHIGAVVELGAPSDPGRDPQVRFEEISQRIEDRLGTIAILRRRVIRVPFDLGQPILVDDPEFDLSFHVVRRAVPTPGSAAELEALVARVMATPLAPDRPMWEISVVEGLAGGRTALIIKLHHALSDGVAGVAEFAGLFDLEASPGPVEVPPRPEPAGPLPSAIDMLTRSSSELLRRPGAILEAIGSSLERLAERVDEVMGASEGSGAPSHGAGLLDAPQTALSGTISHARRFVRLHLSLPAVKEATRRHSGTVTDFAVSITGGALRRLLSEREQPPGKDLVAFVPVNIRVPGTTGELGNRISARLVPLDSEVLDPLERLDAVVKRSTSAKASEEPGSDPVNDIAEAAGPALASLAGKVVSAFELFDHLPSGANVIISSVPGPPVPLFCAGERIERVAPIGPLMFNQGINVTLMSYCDYLELGVLACARRVPDIDRFRELLEEEAAAILDLDGLAVDAALAT